MSKIEALTIKRTAATDEGKEPGKLEFPNLEVSFSTADLASWKAWFDDFVVRGNNSDAVEKSGTLAYLEPSLVKDLLRIELDHIGIFRLEPEPVGLDSIRRHKAELYVETMKVVLPS